MNFSPYKRGTLLIPSGPKQDGLHLFVVMTDACENNHHLLLSVSTIRAGAFYDDACLLAPGDHEFIKAASYVVYRLPEKRSAETLVKCVKGWLFHPREDIAQNVFDRMYDGLWRSRFTPPWVLKYVQSTSPRP